MSQDPPGLPRTAHCQTVWAHETLPHIPSMSSPSTHVQYGAIREFVKYERTLLGARRDGSAGETVYMSLLPAWAMYEIKLKFLKSKGPSQQSGAFFCLTL